MIDPNVYVNNVILTGLREARLDGAHTLAIRPVDQYVPFRLEAARNGDGHIPMPPGTSRDDVAAVRAALIARGYLTIPRPPITQEELF